MNGSFQMAVLDADATEHVEFFDAIVEEFALDSRIHAQPLS